MNLKAMSNPMGCKSSNSLAAEKALEILADLTMNMKEYMKFTRENMLLLELRIATLEGENIINNLRWEAFKALIEDQEIVVDDLDDKIKKEKEEKTNEMESDEDMPPLEESDCDGHFVKGTQ